MKRAKLAEPLAARILAEELVRAQRTTSACAGSSSGDQVKAASAAVRSVLRALTDLGLLAPPEPADPFAGLDDTHPGDPPRPKSADLDEALGLEDDA